MICFFIIFGSFSKKRKAIIPFFFSQIGSFSKKGKIYANFYTPVRWKELAHFSHEYGGKFWMNSIKSRFQIEAFSEIKEEKINKIWRRRVRYLLVYLFLFRCLHVVHISFSLLIASGNISSCLELFILITAVKDALYNDLTTASMIFAVHLDPVHD